MYPVVTSQIAPRPDERRRSPRHPASAIVYVHFGPENGGIVINLGINGLACQTARKLHARENTILNVRLRGSGLDVNLAGEIVWQGATQKEIGIRFKDPTTSQQQDIAKWIAQQEQASKAPLFENFPPPKSVPGMPGVFAAGHKFVPLPLSGPLAAPKPKPADPPSVLEARSIRVPRSILRWNIRRHAGRSCFPERDYNVPSDGWRHAQGRNADSRLAEIRRSAFV